MSWGGSQVGLWEDLAELAGLEEEELEALKRLAGELLSRGELSYEEAVGLVGQEALLEAHWLGMVVPYLPGARCLEWDATPIGPGVRLKLNPAVGAVLRALARGEEPLTGLEELFSQLGLPKPVAHRMALLSAELARKPLVGGSEIASACEAHGMPGYGSQAVALLKAAGVLSPVLASSWPREDVRYRTCRLLACCQPGPKP